LKAPRAYANYSAKFVAYSKKWMDLNPAKGSMIKQILRITLPMLMVSLFISSCVPKKKMVFLQA
jgi:hypothetical protein